MAALPLRPKSSVSASKRFPLQKYQLQTNSSSSSTWNHKFFCKFQWWKVILKCMLDWHSKKALKFPTKISYKYMQTIQLKKNPTKNKPKNPKNTSNNEESLPMAFKHLFFCHKSAGCRPISEPSSEILTCFFRKDTMHSFCFCITNWKRSQFQPSITMNELKKNFRKEKNKGSD